MQKAQGEFDVTLQPLETYAAGEQDIKLGRMSIDKSFKGDLVATSQGEMLTAMTSLAGSAGYVAIEQVNGQLAGRKGSFVLQHFGTMAQGQDKLILEVVPDSGSQELVGLRGAMSIDIIDGQHYYIFEYDLEA